VFVSDEHLGQFFTHEREIVRRNQVTIGGYGSIDPCSNPRIFQERMHGLEKLPQPAGKTTFYSDEPLTP
jgi:hypothetical protein